MEFAMDYETLLYDVADEIATVTLNRPAKMNAYTTTMGAEITDAMLRADSDDSVRVVIITGAGDRAFCAGADMSMFASDIKTREEKPAATERRARAVVSLPQVMRNLSKPTIAAINGYALGVGCTIPLLFDVRIASDNAKMGVIFPRVGLMSELGSSYLMPRLIGLARTAEMMLTGRQYPAAECLAMGLVSRVVPLAELPRDGARARGRHAAMLADIAGLHAQGAIPGTRRQSRNRDGVRGIRAREVLRESRAQGIRRGVSGEAQAELQEGEGLDQLLAKSIEQCLGVFQVGGIEALGEPVVDFREHRARLITLALLCEQPCEAGRGAQLVSFRAHAPGNCDRFQEVATRQSLFAAHQM